MSKATSLPTTVPASRTGAIQPGQVVGTVARWIAYVAVLLFFLTPFIWMVFGSLRNETEIFATISPLSWRTFIPEQWTLKNFEDVLGLSADGRAFGYRFGRNLLNSAVVSVAVVAGNLVFNTLAAYFFSRSKFPGKNVLFILVLAIMFVPWQATIVPLYLVVKSIGIQNSYWGLIVPWLTNPFQIFFLRTMFETIPRELDEAATIDGASRLSVLWNVLLPNSVPALVTMSLLEFQAIWNQFFWPLVAVSSPDLQVIQVAIQNQATDAQVYWGRTFAGSVLASLPVLLFLLMQRYYARGIALSGLKEG